MSTEQATRPDVLGRFLAAPLPIEEIGDWIEDWKPHVYFLEAAGLVKIGHSLHVAARALLIQKCSPVPVAFLLAIPGELRMAAVGRLVGWEGTREGVEA